VLNEKNERVFVYLKCLYSMLFDPKTKNTSSNKNEKTYPEIGKTNKRRAC